GWCPASLSQLEAAPPVVVSIRITPQNFVVYVLDHKFDFIATKHPLAINLFEYVCPATRQWLQTAHYLGERSEWIGHFSAHHLPVFIIRSWHAALASTQTRCGQRRSTSDCLRMYSARSRP